MNTPTADLLARHFGALAFEDIPPDVAAEARRMLLDTVACIVAAGATEVGPVTAAAAAALGGLQTAGGRAYALGRLADAMDFDEGYAGAHFGCGAVGAALALARDRAVDGRELLAAIVAGYELGARVMDAVGPYYSRQDGRAVFSPVWGIATPVVYAAAGAAARLLKLDPAQTVQALALAGSNSPIPVGAVWSSALALPNTKYCDTGWCTVAGVLAALGAAGGSTGLPDLLDRDDGLLRMVSALHPAPQALLEGLGERWRLREVLYKEWPCCGLIAGPMHNLLQIRRDADIDPRRIERIVAEVGAAVLTPRFVNADPRTYVSLQFSLPHNLAMLLLGVPPGPQWLSAERARDPLVQALRAKVEVREHPQPWPEPRPGLDIRRKPSAITVVAGARTYRAETLVDAGEWKPPVWDDAAIVAKFHRQVAAPQADRIAGDVMRLQDLADLAPLLAALDAARAV
ncbi:MAG: MmgE/PrpD family protein [Rubrivivax sp.]